MKDPRGDLSFYYTLTYLGYHEQPFDPKAWRARRELARERRFLSSYVYVLSRCIRLGQPEMIEIGLSILRGEGIALGEKHQTTLVAGLLHRGASDSQVFEETMALSLQGATPLVRAVILHRFFVLSTRHAHPRAPEFRQRLLAMHKHEDAAVRRLVARFLSMNARPEDRPIIDAMLSRYEGRTARDLKGPERSEWYSLNNARDR